MGSDFEFFVKDRICCVIDKDTNGFASVTNDANNVVRQMLKNAGEFDRIIYRDSMGIWDELVVQEGEFAGFAPIGEKDLEKALEAVK